MKYFIPFFLVCSLSFAQTDLSNQLTTSDSLEEDIVGTITPPTQDQTKVVPPKKETSKKSLKRQLKTKHKNKKHKEKIKDRMNKKKKKKNQKNK